MSRSRKKTPISGITTASSAKRWKTGAARKLRRRSKQVLCADPAAFDLAGKCREMVNPWSSEKDSKFCFGDSHPEYMRK